MEKYKNFLSDSDLEKIKEGQGVGLSVSLYSTKHHHGGKAAKGLNKMGNSAAAKKLNSVVSNGEFNLNALLGKIASKEESKEDNPKTTKVNLGEGKKSEKDLPYGHSGSVNVHKIVEHVLCKESPDVSEDAYYVAQNAMNILHRFASTGDNYDVNTAIALYNSRKQELIARCEVGGVIPVHAVTYYNKEVAKLAFVYYEHQIVAKVYSNDRRSDNSVYIDELDIFVTTVRSVKVYTRSLLPETMIKSLGDAERSHAVKCIQADLISLVVVKDPETKLFKLSRINDSNVRDLKNASKTKGYAKVSSDQYT